MLKFLKYLIFVAIILTFVSMGIVINEIRKSHDSSTLFAFAGILIGLASFVIMAAIRYSDITKSNKGDEILTSITNRLGEIEMSISKIDDSVISNFENVNKVIKNMNATENASPSVKSSLLTVNFVTKKDLTK
jgi:hypothetical protein